MRTCYPHADTRASLTLTTCRKTIEIPGTGGEAGLESCMQLIERA